MGSRGTDLQKGEAFTLRASAQVNVGVVNAVGTAVTFSGERKRFIILLDVTNCDTDATDTLDVFVDCLVSGTTWVNAVHFTQRIGTDADTMEFAILDATNPPATVTDVTADAASGVVRPEVFGSQMRARWTMVDAVTGDFTFAVTGYAL
jgi:hypothetical protein